MPQCSPKCPTVRRQLREQIKKAGLTDEYIRSVVHRVDIAEDLERRPGRQVKADPRKRADKRERTDKRGGSREVAIRHGDRYRDERPRDRFEPTSTTRDVVRVTDYEEAIDDFDGKPVASFKQESIYYAEEKQIARVSPYRKVSPGVSQQSLRAVPSKTSRTRSPRRPSNEIGAPIEDELIVAYGRGEVADTAAPYRDHKLSSPKRSDRERPDRERSDRERSDRERSDRERYDRERPDRERSDRGRPDRERPDRDKPDRERYDRERSDRERYDRERSDRERYDRERPDRERYDRDIPGPSRSTDDRRTGKSRDGSPDSFYKYTPKELAGDWPHDDCDESCPASLLKERAKKLLQDKQRPDQSYFADVCTCSLPCVVTQLKKDPFVRNIITSAFLFALGIKLCSELHGWYLPSRA